MRYRNALREGDRWATGQIMNSGVGIVPTLDAIRPHYDAAKAAGKHVGVACGIKNVGMGNGLEEVGRCVLEIRGEDDVICYTGFTDMGQGHDTIMAQFSSHSSGLPTEAFTVICSTAEAVETGMTTASRATYLGGLAALAAGEKLKEALEAVEGDLGELIGQTFFGDWHAPITHKPEDETDTPLTHYAFGFATQMAIVNDEGILEEVIAAHDVGRAINPPQCRGQIEGGVHMGIGYALTEELVVKDGIPDDRFRNLGIIKAHKCPKITAILVEHPDPDGPLGAKGIGEIGLVPTAPAIASALHAFDGIWRTRLPMKDTAAAKAAGVPRRKPKPVPRKPASPPAK
jgi:xanthine dehydrogenase molybdenum-binding subunit